jgi:hypothetical protein
MKRYKTLIGMVLAAILMIVPTTWGQVNQSPSGNLNGNEPLDIEVWTNKEEGASFGQGENLVIYFRANYDCYATIYDLDTKGNINLLYPFSPEDDNYIEGGMVYTIPDYYDDYVLRVNGDPGLEFIQAVASIRYFEVPDWMDNFRDPEGWRDIDRESEALSYLEFINYKYFPVEDCRGRCDIDYTYFEVRKDWKYSWDSYYYDDYDDYDVHVIHHYHPYYYRPVYYDPWWDPWDWYGVMYIDYPYGGAIWIDGIFYGYAPLFIPRIYIGWHDFRILHGGHVYYHDRVKIRRGIRHDFYDGNGAPKWKTTRRGLKTDDPVVKKYYPKEKSISYKSVAKYSAGGKEGNTKVYKSGTAYDKYKTGYTKDGVTPTYKGTSGKEKSAGLKSKTSTKGGTSTKTKSGITKGTVSTGQKSKSGDTKSKGSTEQKSKSGDTKSKSSTKEKDKGSSDKNTKSKSSGTTKSKETKSSNSPSARYEKKSGSTYVADGKSGGSGYSGTSRQRSAAYGGLKAKSGIKSSGSSKSGSGYSSKSSSSSSSKSSGGSRGTVSKGSSSKSSGSSKSSSSSSSGSKSSAKTSSKSRK